MSLVDKNAFSSPSPLSSHYVTLITYFVSPPPSIEMTSFSIYSPTLAEWMLVPTLDSDGCDLCHRRAVAFALHEYRGNVLVLATIIPAYKTRSHLQHSTSFPELTALRARRVQEALH